MATTLAEKIMLDRAEEMMKNFDWKTMPCRQQRSGAKRKNRQGTNNPLKRGKAGTTGVPRQPTA